MRVRSLIAILRQFGLGSWPTLESSLGTSAFTGSFFNISGSTLHQPRINWARHGMIQPMFSIFWDLSLWPGKLLCQWLRLRYQLLQLKLAFCNYRSQLEARHNAGERLRLVFIVGFLYVWIQSQTCNKGNQTGPIFVPVFGSPLHFSAVKCFNRKIAVTLIVMAEEG
jgi:hypothetical protein